MRFWRKCKRLVAAAAVTLLAMTILSISTENPAAAAMGLTLWDVATVMQKPLRQWQLLMACFSFVGRLRAQQTGGGIHRTCEQSLAILRWGLVSGDESLNWHPLLSDFILVGQKLEGPWLYLL